ncbi:hypothetical protein CcaverHIS002_0700280 [Cutaneotrichosporon cavernicola]|uniref:Uncharacterized protein n=1 Tax=Cutaneotrichosporon cavernicola TaxID=279322 RepID=A0AA48QYJ3_9TREE|nr:uncharacterized protein CcaverHIS019_0700280 [Cutaneotrichosporon cavernicola]BEI86682.1 hypothetical protein CcaverHIS002_0700280 [Cutaneotrichosporon cavernicola]BEI94456.1 hypothetical protein CcaverHIS019_0700280 [Cutaneotrichosporon cavernicola]BEJ02233.1 hypothetical protein CcaverHIS631_0700280 [Cutaneotrichosporon cavernicola]
MFDNLYTMRNLSLSGECEGDDDGNNRFDECFWVQDEWNRYICYYCCVFQESYSHDDDVVSYGGDDDDDEEDE